MVVPWLSGMNPEDPFNMASKTGLKLSTTGTYDGVASFTVHDMLPDVLKPTKIAEYLTSPGCEAGLMFKATMDAVADGAIRMCKKDDASREIKLKLLTKAKDLVESAITKANDTVPPKMSAETKVAYDRRWKQFTNALRLHNQHLDDALKAIDQKNEVKENVAAAPEGNEAGTSNSPIVVDVDAEEDVDDNDYRYLFATDPKRTAQANSTAHSQKRLQAKVTPRKAAGTGGPAKKRHKRNKENKPKTEEDIINDLREEGNKTIAQDFFNWLKDPLRDVERPDNVVNKYTEMLLNMHKMADNKQLPPEKQKALKNLRPVDRVQINYDEFSKLLQFSPTFFDKFDFDYKIIEQLQKVVEKQQAPDDEGNDDESTGEMIDDKGDGNTD